VREIEQKFDLADDAVLPSLEGIDGVAAVSEPVVEDLHATYFDTADGRLGRAGVALRRRRGGGDEGWHLKESVGIDERLETHAPIGAPGDDVPAQLVALIRARIRGRGVVPTAVIENQRTARRLIAGDGTVLAEVTDDRVVGTDVRRDRSSTWREAEVELVDGDRDLLAAVARRLEQGGAKPSAWASKLGRTLGQRDPDARHAHEDVDADSTAGEVVTGHLAEQVELLLRFDPLVRQDAPDAVHKMRVGTRRLRSALATFRRVLDRTTTDPIRDELKWLAGLLGAARDTEVIHARLLELLEQEPANAVRGPVAARIDTTMEARFAAARRPLLEALDSERYFALLDALDAIAEGDALRPDHAGRKATPELRKAVRGSWDRWRREVDALDSLDATADRDTQLHEIRKAAKRVRYAGEAVTAVVGAKAATLAAQMEELQEVLGAQHDALVTQGVLLGLADDAAAAGEETFTYGRLHAAEQRRADDTRTEGGALLAQLGGKPPPWLR
jgi:CHAD domain-containing protein